MKCPMESGATAELLEYSIRAEAAPPAPEWEQHLQVCLACRQFVARQRTVWEALDDWEAPPATADFDLRLQRRIELEAVRQPWWTRWLQLSGSPLVRRGLPVAVAAGLLIAAGFILERPSATRVPPQRSPQVDTLQPEQVEHALDDLQMLSDFTDAARGADAGAL